MAKRKPPRKVVTVVVTGRAHDLAHDVAYAHRTSLAKVVRALLAWAYDNPGAAQKIIKTHAAKLAAQKGQS